MSRSNSEARRKETNCSEIIPYKLIYENMHLSKKIRVKF